MDRKAFNECLRPYITGSKPKEQRKLDFCVGAKVCSHKASNREEAIKLCSLSKEPKPVKARRGSKPVSCEKDALKLSHCMAERIDMNLASNINSIEAALVNAMLECQCQR